MLRGGRLGGAPIRPSANRSSCTEITASSTKREFISSAVSAACRIVPLQRAISGQPSHPPRCGIFRSMVSGQHGISPDISDDDCATADLDETGRLNGPIVKPMVTKTARMKRPNDRCMSSISHSLKVLGRALFPGGATPLRREVHRRQRLAGECKVGANA